MTLGHGRSIHSTSIVAFTAVMLGLIWRWTAYELLPDNPPRRRRHHVRLRRLRNVQAGEVLNGFFLTISPSW